MSFLAELQSVGCDLYLHQQALDTSAPSGRAMFQMLGVSRSSNVCMIRERVNAGLATAKERGTVSGRRRTALRWRPRAVRGGAGYGQNRKDTRGWDKRRVQRVVAL